MNPKLAGLPFERPTAPAETYGFLAGTIGCSKGSPASLVLVGAVAPTRLARLEEAGAQLVPRLQTHHHRAAGGAKAHRYSE